MSELGMLDSVAQAIWTTLGIIDGDEAEAAARAAIEAVRRKLDYLHVRVVANQEANAAYVDGQKSVLGLIDDALKAD